MTRCWVWAVGAAVGVAVGAAVGVAVGAAVGLTVALRVGTFVGLRVGLRAGLDAGFRVDLCVGLCLGLCVGFLCGLFPVHTAEDVHASTKDRQQLGIWRTEEHHVHVRSSKLRHSCCGNHAPDCTVQVVCAPFTCTSDQVPWQQQHNCLK